MMRIAAQLRKFNENEYIYSREKKSTPLLFVCVIAVVPSYTIDVILFDFTTTSSIFILFSASFSIL